MSGPSSPLINDLAVVVLAASGVVALCARFRIPALPCHLVAGVLLGVVNRRLDSPLLSDVNAVASLSNLGVSFLMFAIGLEFNFGKARALLAPAVLGLMFQGLAMFAVGAVAAAAMGAGHTTAVFLGAVLGISSTLVSVSSLTEFGHMNRNYGRLTVGILVLEDILAILLLTVLAGFGAGGATKPTTEIIGMVLLIGAFVVLVLTVGRLVVRRVLGGLKLGDNPETLAVIVGGLVLGIGMVSEWFEYSPALGAFVIGAALANAGFTHKIEETAQPFRHLFSAVFFVTLGTSIRPVALWESLPAILPLTLVVLVIKPTMSWLGAMIGGQRPESAARMALNLAQIGEFSFVLTALGERAGVISPKVTAITAGVSLLTIIAHRPLVTNADNIIGFVGRHCPSPLRQASEFYTKLIASVGTKLDRAELWNLARIPLLKIGAHVVFIGSIFGGAILVCEYIIPAPEGVLDPRTAANPVMATYVWAAAALAATPFVMAIGSTVESLVRALTLSTMSRHTQARNERAVWILHRFIRVLAATAAALVFIILATNWMPDEYIPLVLLGASAAPAILFRNTLSRAHDKFENLLRNSFENEADHAPKSPSGAEDRIRGEARRLDWSVHLREHLVAENTAAVGRRLDALALRTHSGASVTSVRRGEHTLFDPPPQTSLFPGDELMLLGTDEQLDAAVALLGAPVETVHTGGFLMEQAVVADNSPLAGETLAGSRIRLRHGVTVAGVRRGETRHLSPGPDFMIKPGDTLLLAGAVESVAAFRAVCAGPTPLPDRE